MMKWNDQEKNPWGNRSTDPLDDLKKRFERLFGKVNSDDNSSGPNLPTPKIIFSLILIALVVWGVSGFYQVENAERAVVTRFGKFTKEATEGLNWHIPTPIEEVQIINVGVVRSMEIGFRTNRGKVLGESLMLTQDENIVDVQLAIQYQISSAKNYLFKVNQPEDTLRQVVESVLREVVGRSKMDFILTEGRTEIANRVKTLSQEALDQFEVGLIITNVNMQDAQAPDQVQDAFEDVVKAREDRERFINEAQAYSNQIIPKARGEAARLKEESTAYREQVIAQAEGQTKRFNALYQEYRKAPKLNRDRMYIDALENVLSNSNKILVDVEGGNNLFYLPLDRLISADGSSAKASNSNSLLNLLPENANNSATTINSLRGRSGGNRTR